MTIIHANLLKRLEESSHWMLTASIDALAGSVRERKIGYPSSIFERQAKNGKAEFNSSNASPKASVFSKQIETRDQGNFTHFNLAHVASVSDQHLRDIPERYWDFVGEIYAQRLSLSPDEICSFIRSSKELATRTKLIVNTTNSIEHSSAFNGGVSVVFSLQNNQQLPFEKSLGQQQSRPACEGSAEIVRLTVAKDADVKNLSRALIHQAAEVILQDTHIQTTYIYTSKLHCRLYRQFGVEPFSIKSLGKRDVLITLKRNDVSHLHDLTYAN